MGLTADTPRAKEKEKATLAFLQEVHNLLARSLTVLEDALRGHAVFDEASEQIKERYKRGPLSEWAEWVIRLDDELNYVAEDGARDEQLIEAFFRDTFGRELSPPLIRSELVSGWGEIVRASDVQR